MNQSNIPPKNPQKIDEEITAYLDGELTGEALGNIEKRLATDNAFRSRLQDLDRGWMLLNELPQSEVHQNFAATTVEMVALHEQHPGNAKYGGSAGQLIQQWAFVGFAVLAACLTGFILSTAIAALLSACGLLKNHNDAVLENFPILQNLDKYKLVENIAFVQAISHIDHFSNSSTDATNPLPPHVDNTAARKAHIDRMKPADKTRLHNAQEYFMALSADEQSKLRDLHQQLVNDPNANDLIGALGQYHEWYKLLDPREHVELRIRTRDDRIAYVKTLLARPQATIKSPFTRQDREIVLDWLRRTAMRKQDVLLRGANQKQQKEVQLLSGLERHRRLTTLLWKQWRNNDILQEPTFDEQRYIAIKERLSPAARKQLNKQSSVEEEVRILLNEVRFMTMIGPAQKGRDNVPGPAARRQPSPEQLRDFFKRLPAQKRDQMKQLPRKEYYRELLREYYRDLQSQPSRKPDRGPPGGKNRTRRDSKNRGPINNGGPKKQ